MNYIHISYPDINNGVGCRVTLWISGCPHHCRGCHNPESWNPNVGYPYTDETLNKILKICKLPYISGLTLSGGEPLVEENIPYLTELCKEVHKLNKNIWCYTGSYWEKLSKKLQDFVVDNIDVLVDGPFQISKLDTTSNNPFKGSTNQSIIKVKAKFNKI